MAESEFLPSQLRIAARNQSVHFKRTERENILHILTILMINDVRDKLVLLVFYTGNLAAIFVTTTTNIEISLDKYRHSHMILTLCLS